MMKMTGIKTGTYEIGEGFMVDIATLPETYEAWLYHKDYGVKDLVFGMPIEQQPYDEFVSIVDDALEYQDYIKFYVEDHMSE